MAQLSTNGIQLSYDMTGPGDGDPLVLVHGFTGSSLDWTDVLDALATDRQVITYDHRGHGLSTNTGDAATYTVQQLVDDLESLVASLQLQRFHLLGHSMGGMVAMRYALRNTNQLASLVLMDTAPVGVGANIWLSGAIDTVRSGGTDAVFQLIEQFTPTDQRSQQILQRARIKYQQMDPVAFVALAEQLQHLESVLPQLVGLQLPTTVLVGQNDVPFRAHSDHMAAAIPGARLVVQAAAGHCPQEDDPNTWMATMNDHLHRATIDR